MPSLFARLERNWLLRGWTDLPRSAVNTATGELLPLDPDTWYAAESCDGTTDFHSLAFLPLHRERLAFLTAKGIAAPCHPGDSIAPQQRARFADNPCLAGIHWCLTGRCNLRCRHCYMEAPAARYGELPFHTLADFIDQFEEAGVLHVSLTGGEPFLHNALPQLLERLAQKHIGISRIFSNGLLVTEARLEQLKRLGFTPPFQISFDGVGAHDRMRGVSGCEAAVLDAIRRICDAGFNVGVSTSFDRDALATLPATYELMKALKVSSWQIAAPQPAGNWRHNPGTIASLEEKAVVCEELLRRWLADGRPFYIQLAGFFRGGRESAPASSADYTAESFDCGACRDHPNLLPDGTLLPCPAYVDSPLQATMPNLQRERLSALWRNSPVRDLADLRKQTVLEANPDCAACLLFSECGAGCRAAALAATGRLADKDPAACLLWKGGYKARFQQVAKNF
jgi:radical SAM protein with 4Fe4S-binding SPASM domain